jgi:hypothetical protein
LILHPIAKFGEVNDRLSPLRSFRLNTICQLVAHGLGIESESLGKELQSISCPLVIKSVQVRNFMAVKEG